jgi:hypothetical protein
VRVLLNRKNVSGLDPALVYNPDGDRPRIAMKTDGSLPLLPSMGLRFRF